MTKKRFCKLARAFEARHGLLTKEVNLKLSDYNIKTIAGASYADIWNSISYPYNPYGIGVKQK